MKRRGREKREKIGNCNAWEESVEIVKLGEEGWKEKEKNPKKNRECDRSEIELQVIGMFSREDLDMLLNIYRTNLLPTLFEILVGGDHYWDHLF